MKTIRTYRAIPSGDQIIEPCTIVIDIPSDTFTFLELGDQDQDFDAEAYRIFRVLYDTLPGGVFDRLLGKMLNAKASHFLVAHKQPVTTTPGGDEPPGNQTEYKEIENEYRAERQDQQE